MHYCQRQHRENDIPHRQEPSMQSNETPYNIVVDWTCISWALHGNVFPVKGSECVVKVPTFGKAFAHRLPLSFISWEGKTFRSQLYNDGLSCFWDKRRHCSDGNPLIVLQASVRVAARNLNEREVPGKSQSQDEGSLWNHPDPLQLTQPGGSCIALAEAFSSTMAWPETSFSFFPTLVLLFSCCIS